MKANNSNHLLVMFSLLSLLVPLNLLAQSTNDDANPVIEELEKNLDNERQQLEGVLKDREQTLAEQAGIRDELAAQKRELEERKKALMELCEQHNSVNTENPMDCDAEVGE